MTSRGHAIGRESYGTRIRVTVGGRVREFPGELTGVAESPPAAAGAARPTVVTYPSGRTSESEPAAASEEPKTLTLSMNLADHLLDYQRIAAHEGADTRLTIEKVRDELPFADLTANGNTIEISDAFVPTFAGNVHPRNVPRGAAVKIGGKVFVIAHYGNEAPEAGAAVPDHSGMLSALDPKFDVQGVTAAGAYKSEVTEDAAPDLAAAVAADEYLVVIPATTSTPFQVKVRSAPRHGDWSGGERGNYIAGSIVLELADGADIPFMRPALLPIVG